MTDQRKRRRTRIVLEAIAGLILGLIFLAGAGIYVLSSGPVKVGALSPMIEDALNRPDGPYQVSVTETQIVWGGWDRALDVVAIGVSVAEADSAPLAILPEVSVGLSFQALLSGQVRITTLEVLGPRVNLLRDADGQLVLSIGAEDEDETGDETGAETGFRPDSRRVQLERREVPGILPAPVLDALTAGADQGGLLGGLTRFSMVQAEVMMVDQALGETVWLHSTNLDLIRSPDGLDAFLSGALEATGEETVSIGLGLRVRPLSERIQASFRFSEIDTDIPARFFPETAFYLPDLTVSGRIDATTDLAGRPLDATLSLDSAAGGIEANAQIGDGLPEMTVTARVNALDPAVWLGGAYDLASAVDYLPRVPWTGTIEAKVKRSGDPESMRADLVSDLGVLTVDLAPVGPNGLRDAAVVLTGFRPDGAAQTAPGLDPLRGVETALNIRAEGSLEPDFTPVSGAIDIALGPGRIAMPEQGVSLPPTDGGQIRLSRSADTPEILRLDGLELAFGEMALTAEGALSPQGPDLAVSASASVTGLQMNRLAEFWPQGMAANPREWVTENIPEALVSEAGLSLAARLPEGDPDALALEELSGEIAFEGADVHYLRPLPPATAVSGLARFGIDRFDIDLFGGRLDDAALTGGRIEITDIGSEVERIAISLDVETPLPTALSILDSEPRRYVSKIGLDPAGIQGSADASVRFRFPLLADLDGDQVVYETDATLRDVALYRPDLSGTVTAENLDLELRPGRLTLSGEAALDGTPMRIALTEMFDGESERDRSLALSARIDVGELARFGLDPTGLAEGRAAIDLSYAVFRAGGEALTLNAALDETALTLDDIGFEKPAGTPSTLSLDARFDPDGGVRLRDFLLDGGADHLFQGSAILDQGGGTLKSAALDALRYGLTDARGTVRRDDGIYRIDLNGPSFDLAPFLRDENGNIATPDVADAEGGEAGAPETLEPRLRIEGRFQRLHDGPENFIGDAELAVDLDGSALRRLILEGFVGDNRDVDIRYVPTPDGGRDLTVYAEDTGLALAVADITGRLDGGILEVTGRRESPYDPLIGRLTMRDFTLLEAPRLAKILEVISVTGIRSALADSGLPFTELTAEFSLTEETVQIRDGVARGPSIGITLSGTYDRIDDLLDLGGDIAIADLLSKTIGQLPIIELLVGEGLLGATYTMRGPIQDPDVAVNPLSVLAPGFLRNIFRSPQPEDPGENPGEAPPDASGEDATQTPVPGEPGR